LYGSLRAVKVLLALLLCSTSTVLASPRRQARIDSRGASSNAHTHDNRGADDNNIASMSMAIQAASGVACEK
jgi:hypothetical protein